MALSGVYLKKHKLFDSFNILMPYLKILNILGVPYARQGFSHKMNDLRQLFKRIVHNNGIDDERYDW